MTERAFVITSHGLVPADEPSREWFARLKFGTRVHGDVKVPRNPKFHRLFFAMLHVAYENHEWPEVDTPIGKAKTSFDMFRSYIMVKSGHWTPDVTPEGQFRPRPKSVAFGNMDEAEFERVYSDAVDTIIKHFLTKWKREDMDRAVNQFMEFAA